MFIPANILLALFGLSVVLLTFELTDYVFFVAKGIAP